MCPHLQQVILKINYPAYEYAEYAEISIKKEEQSICIKNGAIFESISDIQTVKWKISPTVNVILSDSILLLLTT